MKYIRSTFLWLLLILISSCTTPPGPTGPHRTAPEPADHQRRIVRRLADQVLLILATRQYRQLEPLLAPAQPPLSGIQVARKLLGPHATSIVLDRWDARDIEIVFGDDPDTATARTPLTYRRSPNRKPAGFICEFHFRRSSPHQDWRLLIP